MIDPYSLLKHREGFDKATIDDVWINGVYEKVKSPKHGDVVIDVGAHIGIFTVKASLKVGNTGKVYAFEPAPENYSFLLKNTKNLKNTKIYQKAVWSSEEKKKLFLYSMHPGGHTLLHTLPPHQIKGEVEVDTTFIDKAVTCKVDFLKIDAESSELEILRGTTRILQMYKPFIAVETHTEHLFTEITKFLIQYGYICYPEPEWAIGVHYYE